MDLSIPVNTGLPAVSVNRHLSAPLRGLSLTAMFHTDGRWPHTNLSLAKVAYPGGRRVHLPLWHIAMEPLPERWAADLQAADPVEVLRWLLTEADYQRAPSSPAQRGSGAPGGGGGGFSGGLTWSQLDLPIVTKS